MEDKKDKIKKIISEAVPKLIGYMNLECRVEVKDEKDDRGNDNLNIAVFIPSDARFLIGRNGQNLRALEQVLKAMFIKQEDSFKNISVDVNDYKRSKTNYLVDMARQAVTRVRSTQKAETLVPMSAYERRIVHMELASYPDIATESVGLEPQRRIIIKPYP